MLRKSFISIIILVLCYVSVYAQLSLSLDNDNIIGHETIEYKNNEFRITPHIVYSSENPGQIILEFELEIYDKKGDPVDNDNEWIFIITDWQAFKIYFKDEQNFDIVRNPNYDAKPGKFEKLDLFQDGKRIEYQKFESGYLYFKQRSLPIYINVQYIPRSHIQLGFNFIHITHSEKKKKINGDPYYLEWDFLLPEIKTIANVDCKQLMAKYKQELEQKVKGKKLTDFEKQLKFQNVDIKKLKSEFEDYKIALLKITELKKAVDYNKNFDQCSDQKKELLLIFDSHLRQKEELLNLENKIQLYEKNICKNYNTKYTSKLNKRKPGKDLDYFNSKISDSQTSVFQLEDEFQQYKRGIKTLKNIKDQILADPNSKKCIKNKDQLLSRINKLIVNESEISAIDEWINDEKVKLAKNKDLMLDELYNNNSRLLTDFQAYFDFYKIELSIIESEIENRIEDNKLRISDLYEIWSVTSKLTDTLATDTLEQAKTILALCSQVNQKNQNRIDSVRLNVIQIINDVDKKMIDCKKEFISADKENGLTKAQPLLSGFKQLSDEISLEKEELDELRNEIIYNNLSIAELNNNFNPSKQLENQKVLSKYKSLFVTNLLKLSQLEEEFGKLRKEFDKNQYKKSYYKWVKQKYTSEFEDIESKLNSFTAQHDSLEIAKDIDFKEYGINDYIEEISNFEQGETSLRKRLGYLFNDLEKSVYRKFPYIYVLLGIIILAILTFGAKVYVNSLRVKKREQIKKDNQATSSTTKITIKESFDNNKEKGKGISDVRKKVGSEYLEIDLYHEWDDSIVCKVYFKRDCIIKTYRFFEDSLKTTETNTTAFETGGYLIGRWDYNPIKKKKFDITLEEFIEPGDDAKFSNYQLNFGAKIGIRLQKVLANVTEKTGKEYVMTAWFHSHPGLKIFLSDFDLNVQEGFSNNKESLKMLAIVIDPYTNRWDTGFFTYKSDGSRMNNSKDSKRFFSLDTMYNWALNPQVERTDDYFSINLNDFYKDTICEMIYFENSFILEMKRLIEEKGKLNSAVYIQSKPFLKSYSKSDILFEKLISEEEFKSSREKYNNETHGYIIRTDKIVNHLDVFSDAIDVKNGQLQVVLIYNNIKKQITVVTRNSKMKFNKPSIDAILPFKEMIEWTRKRK